MELDYITLRDGTENISVSPGDKKILWKELPYRNILVMIASGDQVRDIGMYPVFEI